MTPNLTETHDQTKSPTQTKNSECACLTPHYRAYSMVGSCCERDDAGDSHHVKRSNQAHPLFSSSGHQKLRDSRPSIRWSRSKLRIIFFVPPPARSERNRNPSRPTIISHNWKTG